MNVQTFSFLLAEHFGDLAPKFREVQLLIFDEHLISTFLSVVGQVSKAWHFLVRRFGFQHLP